MLRRAFVAMVAAFVWIACATASAQDQGGNHQGGDAQGVQGDSRGGAARSVPEFDPLAAGAIAAVVAGGGVLVARRRKKS